ncbi:unnamed protein product [Cuscuta epithymum]|uniref:Uncharacterized protein n=1 Tax=Cuscuta epithymum TaxID=186058 RepID=A0AAV0CT98_9ASTE|nr:unnamed protein product [Cuscuta epithymum]
MERGTERPSHEVVGNEEIKEVDEVSGAPKDGITSEEMESDMGGSEIFCANNHLTGFEETDPAKDGAVNLDCEHHTRKTGWRMRVSSDEDDEDDVIVVAEVKGKGKQVEQMNTHEVHEISSDDGMEMEWEPEVKNTPTYRSFVPGVGEMEMNSRLGGGNTWGGARRYTIEEKGKAKVDGSSQSLAASKQTQMDAIPEGQVIGRRRRTLWYRQFHNLESEESSESDSESEEDTISEGQENGYQRRTIWPKYFYNVEPGESFGFHLESDQDTFLAVSALVKLAREEAANKAARKVGVVRRYAYKDRAHTVTSDMARRIARSNHQEVDNDLSSSGLKEKSPPIEMFEELGSSLDPFSTALKMVKERGLKKKTNLSHNPVLNLNHSTPRVPTLLSLSLKTLAQNAGALVSLEGIPCNLRKRLTDLLCDSRRMNKHMLNLLLKGSPTEIRIKDCSWLTEIELSKSFLDFDGKMLMVLQLDLCGQGMTDHVLARTFVRSSIGFPNLRILSIKGACRITDSALTSIVASAPFLQSINLGQCSLLTHMCIEIISNSLGGLLKELYINECLMIDVMSAIPALKKLKCLEVLSVARIQTVCDKFVSEIMEGFGQNLKELDLFDCDNLTDSSMKAIGDACANLRSLNISNLQKLTDRGIQFLTNGCRSIQRLYLQRNDFSDEALAAYIEASGQCLKELSLNNCSKIL